MTCKGFCKRHINYLGVKPRHGKEFAVCPKCQVTFKNYEYVQCPCCHCKLHRRLGFDYTVQKGHEAEMRLRAVVQETLQI